MKDESIVHAVVVRDVDIAIYEGKHSYPGLSTGNTSKTARNVQRKISESKNDNQRKP